MEQHICSHWERSCIHKPISTRQQIEDMVALRNRYEDTWEFGYNVHFPTTIYYTIHQQSRITWSKFKQFFISYNSQQYYVFKFVFVYLSPNHIAANIRMKKTDLSTWKTFFNISFETNCLDQVKKNSTYQNKIL